MTTRLLKPESKSPDNAVLFATSYLCAVAELLAKRIASAVGPKSRVFDGSGFPILSPDLSGVTSRSMRVVFVAISRTLSSPPLIVTSMGKRFFPFPDSC